MMKKKGIVREIFSKAIFVQILDSYKVHYRDFEKIREMDLKKFFTESQNFQTIPITRIEKITKNNKILFEKSKQTVN